MTTLTVDVRDMTSEDWDAYLHYQRWAIAPLMSPEEWYARQRRIDEAAKAGTLSPNPYEW